jgi:glutaminase
VTIADFERFRTRHPAACERIMRNLARLLAERLIVANAKVDLLTSG